MIDMLKYISRFCLSLMLAMSLSSAGFAANADYAALPPFLTASVKPNVLLVMDFSGSMQAPAHTGGEHLDYDNETARYVGGYNYYYYDGYWHLHLEPEEIITNYSDDTSDYQTYYGYFDSEAYYNYSSTKGCWVEDATPAYTHPEVGDVDCLSGNFLNFLVTTRIDVALKSLIGGKAECPSGSDYCELRPQGSRRKVIVDNLNAEFHIRPEDYTSGDYEAKDIIIDISDESSSAASTIGTWSGDRYARVEVAADQRKGIVQKNSDEVRFGFIAYASGANNSAEEGMIKHPLHVRDEASLINALENTVPYYATHTGEAMREAYRYLTQDSNMYSYNSEYNADTTSFSPSLAVDPYYELKSDGTLDPAWCRNSFVILISDGEWNGSVDPDGWAHSLQTEDLRTDTDSSGNDLFPGDQNADIFSIYAFSDGVSGKQSMKTVAAFGNYTEEDDCTASSPYDLDVTANSKNNVFPRTNCDPGNTYNDCCAEWDEDGDGVPEAYYNAADGDQMTDALSEILGVITQGTSSGTAVTAITSRATTGSAITQAVFYPEREFIQDEKRVWVGNLFSEWYLNTNVDGSLVQNIREDTDGDYLLDVFDDRILEYVVDEDDNLQIQAYDPGTDGKKSGPPAATESYIENLNNLINYGEKLKNRDASGDSGREIWGVAGAIENDDSDTLISFDSSNSSQFDELLGSTATDFPACLVDSGTPQYSKLISFVRGEEVFDCRSRLADSSGNVWKLGDIIYSSPTVVNYGDYRMVYTGSNDGMLHAFRLGYLKNTGNTDTPTELNTDDTSPGSHTDVGKEEWAFIPKDAMPYLRYMADPEYNHIYTVDLKPYIVDIGDKAILIGGMRLGGACGNGPVYPPADTAPVGRSAYFALDITDPQNPSYLWRFAPQGMGFTYSGPAYVKRKDADDNLHHFLIFASGPTDYDGTCSQELQIYVVDLESGNLLHTHVESNLNNAYGGRLFTDGMDVNRDGQTDYVFLGYTDKGDKPFDQMTGGIYKIYTGGTTPSTDWDFDVYMSSNIGDPITGPIRVMDCFPNEIPYPYLYFGSGRYFVSNDETGAANDVNHLYGIPIPCDANNVCDTGSISNLTNASELTCDAISKVKAASWKIPLNPPQGDFYRERCYANPTATKYNMVFFDTTMPTDVVCECGGKSRSWAVNCATGRGLLDDICGDGTFKVADVPFKYLVQLSGGDIQQPERPDFEDASDTADGSTDFTGGTNSEEGGLPLFPLQWSVKYWKQQ